MLRKISPAIPDTQGRWRTATRPGRMSSLIRRLPRSGSISIGNGISTRRQPLPTPAGSYTSRLIPFSPQYMNALNACRLALAPPLSHPPLRHARNEQIARRCVRSLQTAHNRTCAPRVLRKCIYCNAGECTASRRRLLISQRVVKY